MKNRILLVALILGMLLCAPAYSQYFIPTIKSFLADASFGLFVDPLDAASGVSDAGPQPTFSMLKQNYLFGSLSNYNFVQTGATSTVPFILGYYGTGKNPWSVFGDIQVTSTASPLADGTTTATVNKIVGATTYTYNDTTTNTQYAAHQAIEARAEGQYLLGLGSMNLGIQLVAGLEQRYTMTTANWMAANLTQTYTNYYDTAGAGVAPALAVDFTRTTVYTSPDALFDISAGVPLFFEAGGMGIEFTPRLGYGLLDMSDSTTRESTPPEAAGAGSFNGITILDSTNDVRNSFGIGADSVITLPSLFAGDPRNLFHIMVAGSFTLYLPGDSVQTVDLQDLDYAGGGAALTLGANQRTQTTITRGMNMTYGIAPSAQNNLYFDLGGGATWAMGPKVDTIFRFTPRAGSAASFYSYDTRSVAQVMTDGNLNGTFTDAADTIQTTTTTYNSQNDGGTFTVITGCVLPSAVTFRPAGAPFAVTIGGSVGLAHTLGIVTTSNTTQSVSTVTTDGTGTITVPEATTIAPATLANTYLTSAWGFSGTWKLDVTFFLPADGTIDVGLLNGAFYVAGTIPLK